jgi:cell division protein FtsZ
MLDNWNIIGLGGMGINTVNNLRVGEDEKIQAAKFSCITSYDDEESVFQGKLNIKLRKPFIEDEKKSDIDLITAEQLKSYVSQSSNILLIAGLGRATGSKAISSVANILSDLPVKIICAVCFPFTFEGVARQKQAQQDYEALKKQDVKIISFYNQDLFKVKNENTSFSDAFKFSDEALQTFIKEHTNDNALNKLPKHMVWNLVTGQPDPKIRIVGTKK